MGWNSWDSFGFTVNEEEIRETARVMAEHLKPHGWEYIVIDAMWYDDQAVKTDNIPDPEAQNLNIDKYGRFVPSLPRFPSSAGGRGFLPLAEYIHSLGLKFGIHMMRGIPRRAVGENCPIRGTKVTAADIAIRDQDQNCIWNHDCWAIDPTTQQAQAWYDSVLELFASWKIDYVKYDDLSSPVRPERLCRGDTAAIRTAIEKTGRDIVFSLSPGAGVRTQDAKFLYEHVNLWRITKDLWDKWGDVLPQFEVLADWAPHAAPGHWPDPDMLPLGRIALRTFRAGDERDSALKPDEQRTMMTLWCIARAPLMFGGDLRQLDEPTRALITNDAVLSVQKNSKASRQICRDKENIQWVSEPTEGNGLWVATFNIGEQTQKQEVDLAALGLGGTNQAKELWTGQIYESLKASLEVKLEPHACALYHVVSMQEV